MRITSLLLFAVVLPLPAWAEDATPQAKPASAQPCQFYTNDCESCGFDESGKLWCTPSYFGCRTTESWCLINGDGTRGNGKTAP